MMRVIFVDDEPNILNGLKRILRPLRNEWQMAFETDGNAALDTLGEAPCDVIVSDMKMPGMDGAAFLSKVREKYPESIRIALSGETDSNMIYRCVQHAHLYLAKPCDADMLISAVKRAFTLRDLLGDDTLKGVVANMSSLPSLPEQYEKIMQELQSEDPSLQKVAAIVESDVAMSAKILQLVNSAFFGLARHLSSPAEAAMYLGVDVLKSLVLTTGVFSQFDDARVSPATLKSIWNHSAQVGALAKKIALAHTGDKLIGDYALMGGLLSNVGKLVIATNFPEQFAEIALKAGADERPEWEIERESVGHSHTEIGAYLIGLWGLPNPVIECVAFHHEPMDCVDAGFTALTAVHIATSIIDAQGSDSLPGLNADYVDALGLSEKIPDWVKMGNELDDD
ncbi:MAG: HDOD domain-containing protein [Woeseiaceae bacterium]|nr:HDOD domain-containing protein [Woeseiaceae bacterium]